MKEERKALLDIVNALIKNDRKNADDYLDTLCTIATLMNELSSRRFKTVEYERVFKHDRLRVVVQYLKDVHYE